MSRAQARKKISMEDFKKSMKGIQATVGKNTLDEAPQAYKDFEHVMEEQKDSIDVLKHLKPLINWKGGDKKF